MAGTINTEKAIVTLKRFIHSRLLLSGLNGYVIGLSGGIDSAVSASLAARAVGHEKVLAVLMPYRTSSENSLTDAMALVVQLGIEHRLVDITPMVDAYFKDKENVGPVRIGNKMARERMSILFDIAHETDRLVLGTGNRTEIALGYTTWYGDSACSINPLGELYKTEVRLIAEQLAIPESIRTKPPSADLWKGQTDEGEIGVSYEMIDRLLARMVDKGEKSMTRLEAEGFERTDISLVVSLLTRFSFKRHLPDIAPLGRSPIPDVIELDI